MKKKSTGGGLLNLPDDPLGRLLAAAANVVINSGMKVLSREINNLMNVPDPAALALEKQKADAAIAKMLADKKAQLLDLKMEEKRLYIEERKRRIEAAQAQRKPLSVPIVTQVVTGALEVTANADGLSESTQSEGYVLWLDTFGEGKVILVLGRRGSGKTALAAKMAEFMAAKHRMPVYWLGLPEQARSLLPNWITMVSSPDQCPIGCVIVVDEAGLHFLSLAFATDQNRLLRGLLMVCRQRRSSLIVAVQSSRDLEYSVVRHADSIIFREPGAHQPDSERPDIRKIAQKASLAFKGIPR